MREDEKFEKLNMEMLFHDTITANGLLPIGLLREVFDMKLMELGIK